jgi:hypothetical protein
MTNYSYLLSQTPSEAGLSDRAILDVISVVVSGPSTVPALRRWTAVFRCEREGTDPAPRGSSRRLGAQHLKGGML